MGSFVPVFSKIVDSSIWEESDLVVKVFITMLAKQDSDHVVRGSVYNIGRWANKTEDEAEQALEVLCSPDTKRKHQGPSEGRRIRKVGEDEWLILNGEKYQLEMRKIFERARKARWAREHRMVSGGTLEERHEVERQEEGDPIPEMPLKKTLEQAIEDEKGDAIERREGVEYSNLTPGNF